VTVCGHPGQAGACRIQLDEPVFGGPPFAASGERVNSPAETLNTALEMFFDTENLTWQKANLNERSRT
jgi:hypothetical protein